MEFDEVPEIHPLDQSHNLVARRDLPMGALICGTKVAAFAQGNAYLFHHSPNVARAWPFSTNLSPHWRGRYSWSTLELLSNRLEGLILPSALLAARAHRWRIPSHWYPSRNVVLHFLRSGLTCGEILQDVSAGEALTRHFSMDAFTWSCAGDTRRWITKSADEQARVLREELDDCEEYFADCAFHDQNESRPDRAEKRPSTVLLNCTPKTNRTGERWESRPKSCLVCMLAILMPYLHPSLSQMYYHDV